jgi:hypothetical protein
LRASLMPAVNFDPLIFRLKTLEKRRLPPHLPEWSTAKP